MGLAVVYEMVNELQGVNAPTRTKRKFQFWAPVVRGPLRHFAHMDIQIWVRVTYARELLLQKMP